MSVPAEELCCSIPGSGGCHANSLCSGGHHELWAGPLARLLKSLPPGKDSCTLTFDVFLEIGILHTGPKRPVKIEINIFLANIVQYFRTRYQIKACNEVFMNGMKTWNLLSIYKCRVCYIQFFLYIETQWINGPFQLAQWSVYGKALRTNNDVEGWHHRINSCLGQCLGVYRLAAEMHKEARFVTLQVWLLTERRLVRVQRKAYRTSQARLFKLWEEYPMQRSAASLLRGCAATDHQDTSRREFMDWQTRRDEDEQSDFE